MEQSAEFSQSIRFLTSLEKGTAPISDVYQQSNDLDPVIVFWVIQYLRKKYPASNSASMGVLQRIVELTTTYPDIITKAKAGENDSISEWFADSFSLNECFGDGEQMITLLIDKLQS